jgi:hypothetical protein
MARVVDPNPDELLDPDPNADPDLDLRGQK